jgi:uncharacterized tellurite resistance protein B-like protein
MGETMPVLLLLLTVAGLVIFWIHRANSTVQAVRDLDKETRGVRRWARHTFGDLFGTPLSRVRDPRLAAVILMIQLVRTGSPVTASERTQIFELMEDPLAVEDISRTFERAWGYTTARRPFSAAADELLPLLQRELSEREQIQLVAMLARVADAKGEASELQAEAITRLKKRLLGRRANEVAVSLEGGADLTG